MRIKTVKSIDMTQGVIWKQILFFVIPLMIGHLLQQMYGTIDGIVVGKYVGDTALAAVGTTGSIVNMLICIGTGISTGVGIAVSQYFGAHDDEKLSRAVHNGITLIVILSLIISVVGYFLATPMLNLMKTPADVLPDATAYLKIYFLGTLASLLYNIGAGILRAVGDSRTPLYFLCLSSVLNLIGDLVFIIRFEMGVVGVAVSTIMAQAVSAVLVMLLLARRKEAYALRLRKLGLQSDMLKVIVAFGLPSSIQLAVTSFSNVFVQSYINDFQKNAMAGWTVHNRVDAFILLPLTGISMAAATFVGQNYGAGNYKRAREGVRFCIHFCLVIMAVIAALVIIFQRPILGLFSLGEESMQYGMQFITLISPFYLVHVFNQIYASALRGIGKPKIPMIILLSSFVAFRQIYMFINKLLGGSILTTAFGYPAGWIVASVLLTIAYRRCLLFKSDKREPSLID